MKDAYAVLRQKEREMSKLQEEVEALRLAENDQLLRRAVNSATQPQRVARQGKANNRWP